MQTGGPVGIPITAICESNVAWINIRWVKLTYVQWRMTNDLSHRCYFWTFILLCNLSEKEQVKAVYAFPVPVPCLERGKWNHMLSAERKENWSILEKNKKPSMGHQLPEVTSQRECMPSNVPLTGKSAECLDDRCYPLCPTGWIWCPSCHQYGDGCRGTKIRLAGCGESTFLMPSICGGGDRY